MKKTNNCTRFVCPRLIFIACSLWWRRTRSRYDGRRQARHQLVGWAPQPEVGEAMAKAFNESQDDYVVKFKRLEDYEQQLTSRDARWGRSGRHRSQRTDDPTI